MHSAIEFEVLSQLHHRRLAARRGETDQLFEDAARALGCSVGTVYRKLDAAGLAARKRKQRCDAGRSELSDAELRLVAGMLVVSANKKGNRMPVRDALDILHASGKLTAHVHESTVNRQLRQRFMHPDQLAMPSASVQMQAEHVNHVWQVDSTTGAYYYLPGGRLRWMPEEDFYLGKVQNLVKASSDLLTRYSCVDVASHGGKSWHFLGGETAENLLSFVCWAMSKQAAGPIHGVPFLLVMDPGPANKSLLFRNFCKNVGVDLIHHAPGAARTTGSVEKFHDLVGMHFEKRLRFIDPREVTLDRLNGWLEKWTAHYCSTRVHTRHGKTRYACWMGVASQHLRVPADEKLLAEAAVTEPESRRVANDRTISFKGRTYDLSLVPGVVAGLRVTLQTNVFRHPQIDVRFVDTDSGEESWHVVAPVEVNELGYRTDSPVWGREFRTAKNSVVDDNRNALTREAYRTGDGLPTLEEAAKARKQHAQAYAGVVDAMADVNATQVPTYLPKRATTISLPQRQVEARRVTVAEAAMTLRARLGSAYQPQTWTDLSNEFPDGVPEDQLDALVARYAPPAAADDAPLRLIGGGAA